MRMVDYILCPTEEDINRQRIEEMEYRLNHPVLYKIGKIKSKFRKKHKREEIKLPKHYYDGWVTYTVVAGDCLYQIAKKYGVRWEDIIQNNSQLLRDPYFIYPSLRLRIYRM